MYEFVDRPVSALDQGGQFLIWTMRRWVGALGNGRCLCGTVVPAFHQWNMLAGLPHFHLMMALLNRDATEKFRFGPVCYDRVTEHEALILHMIRDARDAPAERMRETAALLICADSVPPLLIALSAFGQALAEAGLWPEPPVFDSPCASFRHE